MASYTFTVGSKTFTAALKAGAADATGYNQSVFRLAPGAALNELAAGAGDKKNNCFMKAGTAANSPLSVTESGDTVFNNKSFPVDFVAVGAGLMTKAVVHDANRQAQATAAQLSVLLDRLVSFKKHGYSFAPHEHTEDLEAAVVEYQAGVVANLPVLFKSMVDHGVATKEQLAEMRRKMDSSDSTQQLRQDFFEQLMNSYHPGLIDAITDLKCSPNFALVLTYAPFNTGKSTIIKFLANSGQFFNFKRENPQRMAEEWKWDAQLEDVFSVQWLETSPKNWIIICREEDAELLKSTGMHDVRVLQLNQIKIRNPFFYEDTLCKYFVELGQTTVVETFILEKDRE
jgi:hypothetical protein